jgi:galactofuranose transport system permease protein
MIGLTTALLALAVEHWDVAPLAAILLLGALFGAFMRASVVHFERPPFIVTLAGMFLERGARFLLSTQSIAISTDFYADRAGHAARLAGGARLIAGMILLRLTRFGADIAPLGGSRTSTALRGVNVGRTTVLVHALSATLAGLPSVVFSRCTSSAYSLCTVGVERSAIAFVGGTPLSGGDGSVFGTFIGGFLQKLIQTDISFDGTLSRSWAKIAAGVPFFVFIALQQVTLRMARRPRSGAAGAVHP